MPQGLLCFNTADTSLGTSHQDQLVDIVAVHGLGEDAVSAWTDPKTGVNWLRDLLPQHIRTARILSYGYDASASSFFGSGAAVTIQRIAECLVQELHANRRLEGRRRRPIIFICHGLGGVLVKKSLVYSSTRTAAKVDHLWDQYISTFAVLFFGTPHDRTSRATWLALEALLERSNLQNVHEPRLLSSPNTTQRNGSVSSFINTATVDDDLQFFKAITGEFMPLMRQFRMFFFWEELRTAFDDLTHFVVDQSSAVLDLDNIEKSGIHATHSDMVKFDSQNSPSYRTTLEALTRYCYDAQGIIANRWKQAIPALQRLRAGEAYELGGLGFDVHLGEHFHDREITVQKTVLRHFYPPQEATPDFIGRDDMFHKVYNAFFPAGVPEPSTKRKSLVVHGMGGSGKTQFCSKFAADCKERYTAVFTVHAASQETIKDSFSKIGKIGGLEATESAGRHFLSQLTEPWLFIIDNADDPGLDIQSLFPLVHTAHILVTTRNPDFRQEGTLGHVELKGLEKAEALHLLLTRADIPKPWDVSTKKAGEAITRTLGYLALALIHAGTCIYRRVCSLGDYLNLHSASRSKLQQRRKSVSNTAEPGSQDDLVHAVYSSFDVSGNFLFNKQTMRSQDASEILNIICFYHFESIPVEIFTRAVANRRRATDKSTLGSFGPRLRAAFEQRLEPPRVLPGFLKGSGDRLDKYRVTWAISELQSLSLISYDSGEGSFTMHPLVQEWARYSLSSSEKALWTSISFNTLMESISLPSESNNESESDFHRDMLPHLDACLQEHGNPLSISIVGLENYQLTLSKICRPTFAMILRDQIRNTAKCGYVLAERGQFKEAVVYLEAVKNNLVKLLGFNHENTMSAMLGMAGVCWGLGRLEEAIALQQQVVDARTKVYGPLDQRTLQAMNQLGRSHWLYGQYQEALTLQELTAERMRVVLGPDHSETLGALDNLGVTLSAWHRFEESMRIHKQVLQVREKTLGDTHPQTLETRSNLAMALKDLGNLQEAKAAMHVVHEQRREQLGKEHPWTLWALCYLAKIHTEMGLLQEAEDMLTWGCEAGERSLSKDHLGVLMGRGELSRIYSRQGRLDEADKLCTETVQLIAESRGVAHPDCVYGTFKLGQLQELRNDKQRAVSLYQLALERAEMRITRAHPLAKKIERLLLTLQNSLSSSEPDLLAAVGSTKSDEQVFRHRGIRSQKTW